MKNKQLIFALAGIIILIITVFVYFAKNPIRFGTEKPDGSKVETVEGVGYIKINNYAFEPANIKIKQGQTVFWTNEDSVAHSIKSDSGTELSSSSMDKGFSYAHSFATEGIYSYHCEAHPEMKGRVIVE